MKVKVNLNNSAPNLLESVIDEHDVFVIQRDGFPDVHVYSNGDVCSFKDDEPIYLEAASEPSTS